MKTYLDLVKFEHTVFALPFAYAGMFLASMQVRGTGWPGWHSLLWVTVAMAAARTAAMGANRVIDRLIDARNPRTAGDSPMMLAIPLVTGSPDLPSPETAWSGARHRRRCV